MRSPDDSVAPSIIKRKKIIAADEHHGGAWKVAYADFVTAMMAFFMLMWLLNATEKQSKGLADYFSPTISINRTSGGGKELFGGDSVLSDGSLPHIGSNTQSDKSLKETASKGLYKHKADVENGKFDQEKLQELLDKLTAKTGESTIDTAVSVHKDAETADIVIKDEEGSVIFHERISKERSECRWKGESNSGETVKNGDYIVFVETFKNGASQGLMDMEAYQKIKEMQLEDGKYSIIFASGLEVDPDSISAVRD